MKDYFIRGFTTGIDSIRSAEPGSPIRFAASTSQKARDGLVIDADGWDTTNFRSNPVVLWAHDYTGQRPPIARVDPDTMEVRDGVLYADVIFDQSDEFARSIENKYRNGFLNAVSVGWNTIEVEQPNGRGKAPIIRKSELLELSCVPVPSDPKALAERQARAVASLGHELLQAVGEEGEDGEIPESKRGAIPPHSTERAPEATPWEPARATRGIEGADKLRSIHAWADPEGDPESSTSYKLPHHDTSGKVVWRGVAAAMARLLQAGTQIPDHDRRGVYNHLARHYRQFDKEPPEYRTSEELFAYGPEEVRGLFFEGETEMFPEVFAWGETRAGKTVSTRNRERLETAATLLQEVLATAEKPHEPGPGEATPEAEGAKDQLELLNSLAAEFAKFGSVA